VIKLEKTLELPVAFAYLMIIVKDETDINLETYINWDATAVNYLCIEGWGFYINQNGEAVI